MVVWIIVVVIGAVLTSSSEKMKPRDLLRNKAFGLFLLTTFLFTFMSLLAKPALQEIDFLNYIAWWSMAQIPVLLITIPFFLKKEDKINLTKTWRRNLSWGVIENIFLFGSLLTMFYALRFSVSLTESLIATNGFRSLLKSKQTSILPLNY